MTDVRLQAVPCQPARSYQSRPEAHTQMVGVDALRFMAAMSVMLYHFCFWDYLAGPPILAKAGLTTPSFGSSLHFGWVGVEVFFVISGFVIAYSAQGANKNQFLRSRILRLLPGAWICATVTILVYALVLHRPLGTMLKGYISCLLFWPFDAVDIVYWTLGVEVSFYAFVFLLIWADRLKSLETAMFAWGVVSGAFWAFCLTLQCALNSESLIRLWVLKAEGARILQLLLVQHGCLFAFGVSLHAASTKGLTGRRAAAVAILLCCGLLELIGQNGIISRIGNIPLSPLPAIVAWTLAMLALVLSVTFNSAIVARLGSGVRFIRTGGRLTYPLYLIHDTICFAVIVLLAPLFGQYSLPLAILAAIGAAMFVERFPERSLRRIVDVVLFQARTKVRVLPTGLEDGALVAKGKQPSS